MQKTVTPSPPRLTRLLVFCLLCSWTAQAQTITSPLSGTTLTASGQPLAGTTVRHSHNGRSSTTVTDAGGRFAFYFAQPGLHEITFLAQDGATATFEVELSPHQEKELRVTKGDGSAVSPVWVIEERVRQSINDPTIEEVFTSVWIQQMPNSGHLWALLNLTAPSVIADRFDNSGMHSDRQLLFGVRGSSWNQNATLLNGVVITSPSGEGMLSFPDVSTLESVTYAVGHSPRTFVGTGAHLLLVPKAGTTDFHGQARFLAQGKSLQSTNVTDRLRFFGITESDERWKHLVDAGVQAGSGLGSSSWTFFGSFAHVNQSKRVRNRSLPVPSHRTLGSLHVLGDLSPDDRLSIFWSGQRLSRSRAGASPQVSNEAALDQTRSFNTLQAAWTRTLSPGSTLDVRFGLAAGETSDDFQSDAARQSGENLFAGYGALGSLPPLELVALLNEVRFGRAPLAGDFSERHWDSSGQWSMFLGSSESVLQKLSFGGSFRHMSADRDARAADDVNLLFFEREPESVLLFSPAHTRDRLRIGEVFASDAIFFKRLTFNLAGAVTFSSGSNSGISSGKNNSRAWTRVSGRFGLAWQVSERLPLVFRSRVARVYHQPLVSFWSAVNPEGLAIERRAWNDLNGDRQYQPGEAAGILKRFGPAYADMDPALGLPHVSEFALGFSHRVNRYFFYQGEGFRRVEHNVMSLVNTGVPFSAYTPLEVFDPGDDGEVGTPDDASVQVFEQRAETLGQDHFLLTNPEGHNTFSEGFQIRLGGMWRSFRWNLNIARYRSLAGTAPGQGPRENDTSALLGIFDNPNNAIESYASTFFDRGTSIRCWTTAVLPWQIRWSVIGAYQDGVPFSRYLPVEGLNQGVFGVLTRQRGPGAIGSRNGFRTTYFVTFDTRFSRSFELHRGQLTLIADIFNVSNSSQTTMATDDTSPAHLYRIPLTFQTPRSVQLGVRYSW